MQEAEHVESADADRSVLEDTDDLLDEIDEALRGLDRDLARTFVQQGGE